MERRRFQRLPLAIPVFLRGVLKEGKEFLDFTVVLNVSAGGALVATRRVLPRASRLSIELPAAPVPLPCLPLRPKHALLARVVRITAGDTCHLCAVRFSHPLI